LLVSLEDGKEIVQFTLVDSGVDSADLGNGDCDQRQVCPVSVTKFECLTTDPSPSAGEDVCELPGGALAFGDVDALFEVEVTRVGAHVIIESTYVRKEDRALFPYEVRKSGDRAAGAEVDCANAACDVIDAHDEHEPVGSGGFCEFTHRVGGEVLSVINKQDLAVREGGQVREP